MIWRIWSFFGILIVGGAWLLAIPYSPAPELKTGTVIDIYRAKGLVPEPGQLIMSSAVGHDVFELPETDAMHRKEAMASGGMGGMKMEDGHAAMDMKPGENGSMKMKSMEGEHAEMEGIPGMAKEGMKGMAKEGMKGMAKEGMEGMAQEGGPAAMDMKPDEHGSMKMEGMSPGDDDGEGEIHGRGSADDGLTILAVGSKEVAAAAGKLKIANKLNINMLEWGFETGMVMGMPGDIIHLVIKNTGNLPHEFMLMDPAGMKAVDYRLRRADWSLLEHEATYEVPVLMPGDALEMIVQIHKSGMWMYMCMFPYHMQMGMMGMLMTPDMMGKGGMGMGGMGM